MLAPNTHQKGKDAVKTDKGLSKDIVQTEQGAKEIEEAGYDGLWVGETKHDPFMQCLLAAKATSRVNVVTSIAIAFARTPMLLANLGFDLALYSQGRFILGLGSQVKPHIERRFSMPWSRPATRMRELILATRAIWDAWQNDSKLNFQGDFYTHTLMTPFFSPTPHPYGPPPIYLAGVNELMTEVAGETCDGFFIHAFSTRPYIDEVTLPALRRGREKTGLTLDGFNIAATAFCAVGRDEKELATACKGVKDQIAFYASTPAYRSVLELHGWGDLQPELTRMTKEGRWQEIGDLITDDILRAFSVVGSPQEVGKAVRDKFGDIVTRITLHAPYESDPGVWPAVLDALH